MLSEMSDRERQILFDITYMWNIKIMQINVYAKQKQTYGYSKQTSGYQMGEGRGGGKLAA